MRTSWVINVLVALSLLPAIQPAQAAHTAPEGEAAQAGSAVPESLLQFTAGGHALGFAAGGMYAATGDHALHVEFSGSNAIQPQSETAVGEQGEAAPLGRVTYADLWDGITLAYTADAGGIYTTTYTLAPGADPADIRLRYNAPLTLNDDGTMSIAFETGAMTESAPIAWQEINSQEVSVDASFRLSGQEVSFALGEYDPRHTVTIDPSLVWNTFLGGSGQETGYDIALDAGGNIYVTGYSTATWGSPVRAFIGVDLDAYAAKLNSSGGLIWNTFLGGSGYDTGYGIAADGSGNVYVTGYSYTTWGSPVRAFDGGVDAYAAKLNSSTGALIWNTFLGGSGSDSGYGIAADGSGNVYLAGVSDATWGSPVRAYTGSNDAFAAKLTSSGALIWNTFLGGISSDSGKDIAVGGSGNIYLAGESDAAWGSPVSPVRAYTGSYDAFAAQLSSSGALAWHTFLGGSENDEGLGIALDGSGNVYVTGDSGSTWGSPVRAYAGGTEAFAVKLNSTGSLSWNTFLGGSGTDLGNGIAVDRGGNVYVAGYSTASWGSPLRAYTGGYDAFAANLNSSGVLVSNTFLGGSGDEFGDGIAVDGSGTYIAGISHAAWGNPPRAYAGGDDGFAARVNLPHTCPLEGLELYDLTGDCRTDVAVYRPSTGAWYIRDQYSANYGSSGDIPVPGDYNGDGTTDIAVYRPSTGAWYIRNQYSAYYGSPGDIPIPGDYNGDGTTELAVYRPSTGAWYVRGMSTVYYGASTDIPVPGDYDGDGATEIAVFRPSTGAWYIRGGSSVYYGASTDIPVPGDYNGDGTTDIAVYRPSTGAWYVRGQATVYYGASTDIPVPGDYDADGASEIAVFRPSTGAWYVRGQTTVYYGASGDIPIPELGTGKAGSAP